MTSVKVKFRPSSIKEKEGSLYYQVIHRRNIRLLKTNYKIFPDEWDITTASICSSPTNPERTDKLTQQEKAVEQDLNRLHSCISMLLHRGSPFSVEDIVKIYKNRKYKDTLNAFMRPIIRKLQEQGRNRTAETYSSTLRSFMRFRHDKEIFLEEINQETIGMYEAYLKSEGLSLNSISFYMRILRAVYNRAVDQELTTQHFPFKHVYTGIEKTIKRSVNIKTIKCVKDMTLIPLSSIDYARDMFIFSFYTRGHVVRRHGISEEERPAKRCPDLPSQENGTTSMHQMGKMYAGTPQQISVQSDRIPASHHQDLFQKRT